MKYILSLFLVFAFAAGSFACSYAYQHSLFAFGEHEGLVYFVELDLERYVSTPNDRFFLGQPNYNDPNFDPTEIKVRWKGKVYLRASRWSSLDSAESQILLARLDFADDSYYQSLLPSFEKARDILGEKAGFIWAKLPRIGYCNYQQDCSFFTRKVDTLRNALAIQVPKQASYHVSLPEKANEQLDVLMRSAADMQQSKRVFALSWKPYSLREYSIGGKTLHIYTVGRGQKRFYEQKPASPQWAAPPVGRVEEYIEGNDVLFHGQRFDFLRRIK